MSFFMMAAWWLAVPGLGVRLDVDHPIQEGVAPALATLVFARGAVRAEDLEWTVSGRGPRRAGTLEPLLWHPDRSVRLARLATTVHAGERQVMMTAGGFSRRQLTAALDAECAWPTLVDASGRCLARVSITATVGREARSLEPIGQKTLVNGSALVRRRYDAGVVSAGGELRSRTFMTLRADGSSVDVAVLFVAHGSLSTQSLCLGLQFEPEPARASIAGVGIVRDSGEGVVVTAAANGDVSVVRAGKPAASIDLAPDLEVVMQQGAATWQLEVADFRWLGPKKLTLAPSGAIELDALCAPRAWLDGDTLRLDLRLSRSRPDGRRLAGDTPLPRLVDSTPSVANDPLFARWAAVGSRKAGLAFMAEAGARLEDEVDAACGTFDRGDYRLSNGCFANLEFDPTLGLAIDHAATRCVASLRLAERLMRHWSGYDIIRGSLSADVLGLPWQHGEEHASGRFELGHVFVAGAVRSWCLLDDPILDEVVERLLDCLPEACTDARLMRNERSLGWGLAGLADVALVRGDASVAQRIDQVLSLLASRQAPEGYFRIDTVTRNGEACWRTNLWVTAITVGEALFAAMQAGHDRNVRPLIERLAGFFDAQVAVSPSWSVPCRVYHRQSDGAPAGSTGSLRGADLALVAAFLEQCGHVLHRPTLTRKASALWARVQIDDCSSGAQLAKLLRAAPFALP